MVDGQQRIRSILEYIAGSFTVLAAHNKEFSGRSFSSLDEDAQSTILQYEIGVDILYNVGFGDLLDIFARINTYSVTLNAQEKLNAKYLGVFKTSAYELGFEYVDYLLEGNVLTERNVTRMSEARLASDLLVALVGGVQTLKNIEKYYRQYEDSASVPDEVSEAMARYRTTMRLVGAIYPPEDLKNTNWSRQHWFYTLFTCAAHARNALGGLEGAPRPALKRGTLSHWRAELDEISALYDRYTEMNEDDVPARFARYINYAQRRTTDTEARIERGRFVLEAIGR